MGSFLFGSAAANNDGEGYRADAHGRARIHQIRYTTILDTPVRANENVGRRVFRVLAGNHILQGVGRGIVDSIHGKLARAVGRIPSDIDDDLVFFVLLVGLLRVLGVGQRQVLVL